MPSRLLIVCAVVAIASISDVSGCSSRSTSTLMPSSRAGSFREVSPFTAVSTSRFLS